MWVMISPLEEGWGEGKSDLQQPLNINSKHHSGTIMNIQKISRICTLFVRSFAGDMLQLLVKYEDISASEAASRLNIHIKTAQDFLEELAALEIAEKTEAYERKRPYFRFKLKQKQINLNIDLTQLYQATAEQHQLNWLIRERVNSGATFTTAGQNNYISSVSILTGEGRQRRVWTISLNLRQGRFLYYLPFPNADYLSVAAIMQKAQLEEKYNAEILDIVEILHRNGVIDRTP